MDFWGSNVWGVLSIVTILLISLILSNIIKRVVPFINKSLIPTSVLGGLILLIFSSIYTACTGKNVFNTSAFGGDGLDVLEIITYHALAIGFVAQTLKVSERKLTKKRATEIFNTGVTTVSTYLLQAFLGLGITIFVSSFIMHQLFPASGVLLCFGFGQGTGQALNFGTIYQNKPFYFDGGADFGLSIAALGFLCASIGGVIYLNVLRKKGHKFTNLENGSSPKAKIIDEGGETSNGSIDKLTFQIGLIAVAYAMAYGLMYGLGELLPNMRATIYGFNFLFGVLTATLVKLAFNLLYKKSKVKKQYQNNYLLTRLSNFSFDIMIVAGIAAIRLEAILQYWHILIILAAVGLVSSFFYNKFIAKKFFPEYKEEQFMVMYGMLTGTASTGVMLLRELDPEFKTPANENLVYQNLPAIVFGFPLMLLANFAPVNPLLTLVILFAFFIVMNIILFRSFIFRRKKPIANSENTAEPAQSSTPTE